MNSEPFPIFLNDSIAAEILKSPEHPFDPLPISPWLAMSLMQKAVRRGEETVALRAAATLLRISPARLWRRCAAVAFEDIGVADVDTIATVVTAASSKRSRALIGDEWLVAAYLISRMAAAPKCRAADDILISADQHPRFDEKRREFADQPIETLLEATAYAPTATERALALWYAMGTNRWSAPHLELRKGDRDRAFSHLVDLGVPSDLVSVCRLGYRLTGEALAPFVGLLSLIKGDGASELPATDDVLPAAVDIGGISGWALDTYSREGRAALKEFLRGDTMTAEWVNRHIPPRRQVNLLGGILFRIEGGLVRSRLRWPTADALRNSVDTECHGIPPSQAADLLQLLTLDLNALNEVRRRVL